jgi:hypothetical protein
MTTFVLFLISLVLIGIILGVKDFEFRNNRKTFFSSLFSKGDKFVLKFRTKFIRCILSINFKNIQFVFSWLLDRIKKSIVILKRRFDHKQTHFFTQKDNDIFKNKGSVSFFLKDVSDYKKSLREGKESDNN